MHKYLIIFLLFTISLPLCAFDTGKSPMKASLFSFVVPGAGQYYNGKPMKAGAFFASEATFVGMAVYHHHKMNEYYDKAVNSPVDFPYNQSQYESYYNKRQSDYWWIGTTTFLSVLDAFVDANLYNFEVKKQELHLKADQGKLELEFHF